MYIMYGVGQVAYILPHHVLVRDSVGVAYWSGVRPCTGQGLCRGSRTGQGSHYTCDRYIYIYTEYWSGGSVGFTYWSGVRSCTGQWLRKGSSTGQGSDRVLVKGSGGVAYWLGVVFMSYTHTHTHTHTYTGVVSFSTDTSAC